ncbi:DUF883 family protein [Marinobacter nauticus]|uniref:DUF883 family protein n=1 Tax=Marinobacter nauticus TaxID=2743 RepID=UPI001C98F190|nr:hypothetical protein [Marinobacter nauticus]MBY5936348.1 hypothetical protein [Marinobacter nauticus]MBY5953577.1 hypothetical protein [Marinobacter nauticus]MBY6007370.1 hypothetical protein [Marinobacter nauticus]
MMEAKSGQQNEYEQVREDLRRLQEDMAKLTRSVAEGQKNNISHLRDEIRRESREAFDQVKRRGDEAIDRAKEASGKAVENVEHKIEERPFLSIVLMFLAGLLVGRLLDR